MKKIRFILALVIVLAGILPFALPVQAVTITVGSAATDRGLTTSIGNQVLVAQTNPISANGTITSVEMWLNAAAVGVQVATVYASGNVLTVRDYEVYGDGTVAAGSKVTRAVSLDAVVGDYIAISANSSGAPLVDRDNSGTGYWIGATRQIPFTGIDFGAPTATREISLYGTGTATENTTASIGNLSATNVLGTTATIAGNITDTGGTNPTVTMFWGATDGGQAPGSWSNNSTPDSPAQPQGVAGFTKALSSLTENTLYYYTARAVNDAGTNWTATANFTTPTISPPDVTTGRWVSVGSTNVTGVIRVTALNGALITNTAVRWGLGTGVYTANHTTGSLSGNTGRYYEAITGLTANTTYFYQGGASNDNGITWTWGSEVSSKSGLALYNWESPTYVYSDAGVGIGQGNDWSPEGDIYAEAGSASPYVKYYKFNSGTSNFSALANPTTLPPDGNDVSFSPDGTRIAVSWHSGAVPWVYWYSRSGDTIALVNSFATTNATNEVDISSNGEWLATGGDQIGSLQIWQINGDNFTSLMIDTQPGNSIKGLAFSNNSTRLAVGTAAAPFLQTYTMSDNGTVVSWVKDTDPASAGNAGYSPSWSPNDEFVFLPIYNTTGLAWFQWTSGAWVKLSDPDVPPGFGQGQGSGVSPDGNYVALAQGSGGAQPRGDFIYLITSNTSLTLQSALPATHGNGSRGLLWSPDQQYFGYTAEASPYASIYKTSGSLQGAGISAPTVTTQAVTNIETITATANGNITALGGENATAQFVQYGTSPGVYPNAFVNNGDFGVGAFTVSMTGLASGTTYYARAGATNSSGNGTGVEVAFITKPSALMVDTFIGLRELILVLPVIILLGIIILGGDLISKGVKQDQLETFVFGILIMVVGLTLFTIMLATFVTILLA